MKKYELLCIIKPNLDIDGVEQVIKNIEDTIKNYGGNVLNTDKMGRKKLAYDIDKFRDGFFVVITMELAEDKIVTLRRNLRLNEDIIRELVTVKTEAKAVSSK